MPMVELCDKQPPGPKIQKHMLVEERKRIRKEAQALSLHWTQNQSRPMPIPRDLHTSVLLKYLYHQFIKSGVALKFSKKMLKFNSLKVEQRQTSNWNWPFSNPCPNGEKTQICYGDFVNCEECCTGEQMGTDGTPACTH